MLCLWPIERSMSDQFKIHSDNLASNVNNNPILLQLDTQIQHTAHSSLLSSVFDYAKIGSACKIKAASLHTISWEETTNLCIIQMSQVTCFSLGS